MPLQHGSSREIIANNIKEMISHGHPKDVAVAAAYASAGKAKKHVKKCYYCGQEIKNKDIKSLINKYSLVGNENNLIKSCLIRFKETMNIEFLKLALQINKRGE